MKKFIALILALFCFLTTLPACSSTASLVGTWELESDLKFQVKTADHRIFHEGDTLSFYKDGSLVFQCNYYSDSDPDYWTYEVIHDGESISFNMDGSEVTLNFDLSGKKLVIYTNYTGDKSEYNGILKKTS